MKVQLTVASVVAILTILGGAFMAFSSVSEKAGQYTKQVSTNTEAIAELRKDVKAIVSRTDKIGTDIEWIKETLREKL